MGFSHEVVDAIREVTTENDASFEVVIDEPTLDVIRGDTGRRTRFRDVLESGNASMALCAGGTSLDADTLVPERPDTT